MSSFLYRGDSRDESIIFAEGFSARDPELAKDAYTEEEILKGGYGPGYIATSKSPDVALNFPVSASRETCFVYVLNFVPIARRSF